MGTKGWGPSIWFTIHITAFSLQAEPTKAEVTAFKQFIQALPDILPCRICGEHLRENLKAIPPPLDKGGDAIYRWTIRLHNLVNEQLGKPLMTEEAATTAMLERLFGVRPVSTAQAEKAGQPRMEQWLSLGAILALGGTALAVTYGLRGRGL